MSVKPDSHWVSVIHGKVVKVNIAKAMKVEANPNRPGKSALFLVDGVTSIEPTVTSLGVGGMAQGTHKSAGRERRRRHPSFYTSRCYGGIGCCKSVFGIPTTFSSSYDTDGQLNTFSNPSGISLWRSSVVFLVKLRSRTLDILLHEQ